MYILEKIVLSIGLTNQFVAASALSISGSLRRQKFIELDPVDSNHYKYIYIF